MARFTMMTEPFLASDISITLELELKGVKRFGVAEATIYSIKKDNTPSSG